MNHRFRIMIVGGDAIGRQHIMGLLTAELGTLNSYDSVEVSILPRDGYAAVQKELEGNLELAKRIDCAILDIEQASVPRGMGLATLLGETYRIPSVIVTEVRVTNKLQANGIAPLFVTDRPRNLSRRTLQCGVFDHHVLQMVNAACMVRTGERVRPVSGAANLVPGRQNLMRRFVRYLIGKLFSEVVSTTMKRLVPIAIAAGILLFGLLQKRLF